MNNCITDLRINAQGVLQYSTDNKCTWHSVGVVSGSDGQNGTNGTNGTNGITPHIHMVSKHWMIGDSDTGIVAEGKDGDAPYINQDGYWVVEGIVTQYKAAGTTYDIQVAAGAHINVPGTASVVSSRDDVNKIVTITFDYLKGAKGDTPALTATQTFDEEEQSTGYDIMVGDILLCHLNNGNNGADGQDGADGDTVSIVPDDEHHNVSFYVNNVWKATINDGIQYQAGDGIDIDDDTIAVKYDDSTIKKNGTTGKLYVNGVLTDRYVNSATFADDSTSTPASPVKMTLTRAGSDTQTVVANVPKVSSSSAGVVPKGTAVSTQSQTTKFLREDGTWAAPSYTSATSYSAGTNISIDNNNAISALGYTWTANTSTFAVTGQVNASNGFFQTSDIRKKNVLGEISLVKAYELVDKCQTILYVLKEDKEQKVNVGMVAQEVQEFFPELISVSADGFLSLDYSKLTVIIFSVLKDLINRISKLEDICQH